MGPASDDPRHGRGPAGLSAGISGRGRAAQPDGLPLSQTVGRTRHGLGHDRDGHGRNRCAGIYFRLCIRCRGRTGLRCGGPARHGRPEGNLCTATAAGRDLRRRVSDRAPRRIGLFRYHHHRRRQRGCFPGQRPETFHRGRRGCGLLSGLRPHGRRPQGRPPQGPDLFSRGPGTRGGNGLSVRPDGLPRRRGRSCGFQRRRGSPAECIGHGSGGPKPYSTQ